MAFSILGLVQEPAWGRGRCTLAEKSSAGHDGNGAVTRAYRVPLLGLSMIAAASSASGASLQPEAGYGPDPVLPAPHKQLLPTIKIAHAEPRGRRRPGHDKRYAIDPTKLETELGYEPRTDFENGIRQTVAWYLDRADWWRPLRERYDGQRLGLKAKAAP